MLRFELPALTPHAIRPTATRNHWVYVVCIVAASVLGGMAAIPRVAASQSTFVRSDPSQRVTFNSAPTTHASTTNSTLLNATVSSPQPPASDSQDGHLPRWIRQTGPAVLILIGTLAAFSAFRNRS